MAGVRLTVPVSPPPSHPPPPFPAHPGPLAFLPVTVQVNGVQALLHRVLGGTRRYNFQALRSACKASAIRASGTAANPSTSPARRSSGTSLFTSQ